MASENLGDVFKHLTIVNFNYDRGVEHFLFHAMQAWSLKNEGEVAELMKSLSISSLWISRRPTVAVGRGH